MYPGQLFGTASESQQTIPFVSLVYSLHFLQPDDLLVFLPIVPLYSMISDLRIGVTLLLLLLLYVYVCVCLCPENGVPEAFKCLYNITHGQNGSNVLAGTDTETLRHYCSDGLFNRSIQCVEGLFDECSQTKEIEMLRKIANPAGWRSGASHLCNNLALHAKYSECIVTQRSEILGCLNHNDFEFHHNMQQRPMSWKSLAFNVCRYYEGMKICTSVPVARKCGLDVSHLLAMYITSIAPPLCYVEEKSTPANSANYLSLNTNIITVSFIFTVHFFQCVSVWGYI